MGVRTLALRYVTGRPLSGYRRTDCDFFHRGTQTLGAGRPFRWSYLAGWERAAWRIGTPVAVAALGYSWAEWTAGTELGGGATISALTIRTARRTRRRIQTRRFRKFYTRPLAKIIGPALGVPAYVDPETWLTVSPDLPGLTPRIARDMSPAETWTRERYARHLEPALRWAPDRVMLGYWAAHAKLEWFRKITAWFRNPAESARGSRVEIRVPDVLITKEIRETVHSAVSAKLGLGDLEEQWSQIGPEAVGTFTIKARPPEKAGLDDVRQAVEDARDNELVVGVGVGGKPIVVSLDDDSPHFACSAGSGAGKSVLAKFLAVQILRRGGRVIILDRKGSHRWARGLDGITYCTRPADMHAALIGVASLADARNTQAMEEEEGWIPGERVFVIFEEMNATVAMLKMYWENTRERTDPKTSPAITAFREIMYMGRSAYCHLFGIAQMLTAQTTGGPEARENFGVRALARYTANAWKMLAPECAMPKKSKIRGRWQFVIAGTAVETQVPFLTDQEAAELARSVNQRVKVSPDQAIRSDTSGSDSRGVTLREAATGLVSIPYNTLRVHRDRYDDFPKPIGGDKARGLRYDPDQLVAWATRGQEDES